MKISMKVMLMSLVMLFVVTAASAQKKNDTKLQEKAQAETDQLVEALGLNEDVAAKIYEITLNAKMESRAVSKQFKAGDIEKEEKKVQMKAIGKKKHDAIKALLSPDEKKAFINYNKEQKAKKKAAKKGKK